jgi:hypothetical protein
MFIYPVIKHYKELWRIEDRVQSGRLKSVRADASIKTVWVWICRNPLWKQKVMSRELNIPRIDPINVVPHLRRSTHESTLLLKVRHPYSCFEGNVMDKSKVSPPVAR